MSNFNKKDPPLSWELVGWGTPVAGDAIERREESLDWHNMEAGDPAPTDSDIRDSTEAVIKVTDDFGASVYYTVHLDLFDDLDDFETYVDDAFLEQYG